MEDRVLNQIKVQPEIGVVGVEERLVKCLGVIECLVIRMVPDDAKLIF